MLLRVGIITIFLKYALLIQSFGAKQDDILSSQGVNSLKDSISQFLFKAESLVDSLPVVSNEFSEKALLLANELNLPEQEAFASYLIGKAKLNIKEYYEARKHLRASLIFYQHSNKSEILSFVLYNLAISELHLNLLDESFNHFFNASIIFNNLDLKYNYAKSLQSLGHVKHSAQDYEKANSFYCKALDVFKSLNDISNAAYIYQNIGMLNFEFHYDSLALINYQNSIGFFEENHNLNGIGSTYNYIGLLYLKRNQANNAFLNFQNSYRYFIKSGNQSGQMWALNSMGSSKAMNKELSIAEEYYLKSLALAKELKLTEGILTNYSDLAKSYEERGEYKNSLALTKEYNILKDSFSKTLSQQKITKLESLYNIENKEKESTLHETKWHKKLLQFWSIIGLSFILIISFAFIALAFYQKRKAEKRLSDHKSELEQLIEKRTNELKQQISERKIAEESDKLKSAFLANMSHELRTPMNAIIAFSNFLREPDLPRNKHIEYLDHITTAGDSLLRLIDDIIDIAKIESNQLKLFIQPTNISRLLIELHKIFGEIKYDGPKKDVELKLKMNQQFHYIINTDEQRLKQVLTNLIDNAFKYTKKGFVEIGFSANEKHVTFFISDTGIGIPKDKHEAIFERFYQLNNYKDIKTGGTGLGLAISKNLVKLLGGSIKVESTLGKGSSFYVNIPVESIKKQTNTNIKSHEKKDSLINNGYNWSNITILVAEDEDLNYKVLETCLLKTKANVIRALDGNSAINIFKSEKIDLILMDIQLPEMDGYQATTQIKNLNNRIPIIAQTSFAMPGEKDKCLQAGCDDFITKPLNIKVLLSKIEHFINSPLVKSRN